MGYKALAEAPLVPGEKEMVVKGAAEMPIRTPQICWTSAGPKRMKIDARRVRKRL